MTRFSVGDKIKARHRHNGVAAGTAGTVVSVHQGVFYGVAWAGSSGPTYSPSPHVTDDVDDAGQPDADDTPATGPVDTAAAAWSRLMDLLGVHG